MQYQPCGPLQSGAAELPEAVSCRHAPDQVTPVEEAQPQGPDLAAAVACAEGGGAAAGGREWPALSESGGQHVGREAAARGLICRAEPCSTPHGAHPRMAWIYCNSSRAWPGIYMPSSGVQPGSSHGEISLWRTVIASVGSPAKRASSARSSSESTGPAVATCSRSP